MAEWMLTDKELAVIWQDTHPGQSYGAYSEGRRAAKAQARKLLNFLHQFAVLKNDEPDGKYWVYEIRMPEAEYWELKKEVGDAF